MKRAILIEVDSPLYKRRLIREINSLLRSGASVYQVTHPFNRKVVSVTYGPNTNAIIVEDDSGKHSSVGQTFTLGNGEEIVASREI